MLDTIQTPDSSNIAFASYDDEARVMEVEFRSGGTWVYENVPVETWDGFKSAPSKGEYLHRQVKGRYATRKA